MPHNLVKHFECAQRINALINRKNAESPTTIAKKLDIAPRTVLKYIAAMKLLGAPIKFCRKQKRYIYTEQGNFVLSFVENQK